MAATAAAAAAAEYCLRPLQAEDYARLETQHMPGIQKSWTLGQVNVARFDLVHVFVITPGASGVWTVECGVWSTNYAVTGGHATARLKLF